MPQSKDPTTYPDMARIVAAARKHGRIRVKAPVKPFSYVQRFYGYRRALFLLSIRRGDPNPGSGVNDIATQIDEDAVIFYVKDQTEFLKNLEVTDEAGNPISLLPEDTHEPLDEEAAAIAKRLRDELKFE